MWVLVYKEFIQVRSYLLKIVVFMVAALALLGKVSPAFITSYLTVMPVVLSMVLPQMVFGQEERGNTFVFLRSLPMRPRDIVAAKYLMSVLVNVAFIAIIALAGPMGALPMEGVWAAMTTVTLASFVLAGLSYFLHFWLGAKTAELALLGVTFAAAIPVMLVLQAKGGTAASVSALLNRLEPLATSPAGVGLAFLIGLAALAVSYAASSWLFTKRDLSKLP